MGGNGFFLMTGKNKFQIITLGGAISVDVAVGELKGVLLGSSVGVLVDVEVGSAVGVSVGVLVGTVSDKDISCSEEKAAREVVKTTRRPMTKNRKA